MNWPLNDEACEALVANLFRGWVRLYFWGTMIGAFAGLNYILLIEWPNFWSVLFVSGQMAVVVRRWQEVRELDAAVTGFCVPWLCWGLSKLLELTRGRGED